jgi:hypothetical protein
VLADANCGDVPGHRDRAAQHRQLASEDRAASDAMLRAPDASPPASGPS